MKGDFTRNTFNKRKHYRRVLMQQGRVQLDADWNEQIAIDVHLDRTARRDIIGHHGGPKGNGPDGKPLAGFNIIPQGTDFRITAGRYYVDGILVEHESEHLFTQQVDFRKAKLPEGTGRYLFYLDVWERHLTALEDPEIREVALGGPDTATRTRVLGQVKWQKVTSASECEDFKPDWIPDGAESTGRLAARAEPTPPGAKPCLVPEEAGYRSLENQLYRVEIHKEGKLDEATFKVSRENAFIVTKWEGQDGDNLIVSSTGRDEILGFANQQWVELTDEVREQAGVPGTLVEIDSVAEDMITIDPSTATGTTDLADFDAATAKIRRWDSDGAQAVTVPGDNGGWIHLEDGVQIKFKAGNFRTGDYWLIPARTLTHDIEWDTEAGTGPEGFQLRHGIHHYYCPLALVTTGGNQVKVTDCREFFPPLTAITADDVSFDGDECDMDGVETVQEAIDTLCQREGGICRLTAIPGKGWEKVFDRIPKGQDALICFQVGDYPYDGTEPVTVKDKGAIHIKISGSGGGTRIIAQNCESALSFIGCESVVVSNLYAESKASGQKESMKHLNGVLSFVDVPYVTVENTTLKCRAGTRRMATCITVRNSEDALNSRAQHANVRIRHNDLHIGNLQSGVLLVNTARVTVEDNSLAVVKKPSWLTFDRLMRDNIYRGAVRRTLVRNFTAKDIENATTPTEGGNPVTRFNIGNFEVGMESHEAVSGEEMGNFIMANMDQPDTIRSTTDLVARLNTTLDNMLLRPDVIAANPALNNWFAGLRQENPAVASQGIVVGGRKAEDVRILNNTIYGVLQGIHVAQSRKLKDRSPNVVDRTERMQIIGNTVTVLMPKIMPYERHGIFSGNCGSLAIENNYVIIKRYKDTLRTNIDGIRVFGIMGRMVKVCQNHIEYPTVGLYFNPLNLPIEQVPPSLWIFGENMVVDPLSGESLEVGDRPQKDESAVQKNQRLQRNQLKRKKVTTYRNWP